MKQELQDKLVEEFSLLYNNSLFDGFWIDDAWYDLIYNLSKDIYEILLSMPKEKRNNFCIIQVKSKFSGLRYYAFSVATDPKINDLIARAENDSYTICLGCSGKKTTYNIDFCKNCSAIKNILE